MRTLPMLFATTSLLASVISAQPVTSPTTGPTTEPTAEQMMDMAGSYALADGRVARVFVQDQQLYIELGGQQKLLLPVAPDRYASRDGSIALRYRPGPATDDIVLDYTVTPTSTLPMRLAGRQGY